MAKQKSRKSVITRRSSSREAAEKRTSIRLTGRAVLPLFLSVCILICLGALGFLGYRTVTASDFFDIAGVDVKGADRSSEDDIRRIVAAQVEKAGVWNSDLAEIKARVEKLTFVKSAAVSRVLPNAIRVAVVERVPEAVVKIGQQDFLVDGEGNVLAPTHDAEKSLPFTMLGWDEAKSEKADKENLDRVKTYRRMLEEWRQFDLASRVRYVNLADLREPRAITEDSGREVSIALGRENFGEHLKRGITAIVGKGEKFEAVNLVGQNMILAPRKAEVAAR